MRHPIVSALVATLVATPVFANPMVSGSAIGLGAPATGAHAATALVGVGVVLAVAAFLTWRAVGR